MKQTLLLRRALRVTASMCLGVCVALQASMFLVSDARAQALGDYDGDGTSDLSLALVEPNANYTAWLTRRSNGAQHFFWTWGIRGDAFAPGKYFGNGITYPAIVHVRDLGFPLHWFFKRPDGSDLFLLYGLPGDTVPNHGPDFDGDGISELYVVRDGRPDYYPGEKIWYISSSKNNTVYEIPWGLAGDVVYGADMNGNGKAELIALRPSTYTWYSREIDSANFTQVQWGLPGDIPLIPQDMNQDGSADYMISRIEGANQFAYVRYATGGFEKRILGQATSLPMAGNFKGHMGFAWQQRDTGWTAIGLANNQGIDLFRHGIPTNFVIRPDGSAVAPTDSGRVSPRSNDSGGGGGDTPTPPSGSCSTPRFPDGGNGALWKPDREGGFTSGEATYLIPPKNGRLSTSVVMFNSQGVRAHTLVLRYHYGHAGRTVWDATATNSELARSAPLTIRTTYSDGSCEDRQIPDPHRRYD